MATADQRTHEARLRAMAEHYTLAVGRFWPEDRAKTEEAALTAGSCAAGADALARVAALEGALRSLIDQLDVVHRSPEFLSTAMLPAIHGIPYTGPTYGEQLEAARAALGETPSALVEVVREWQASLNDPARERATDPFDDANIRHGKAEEALLRYPLPAPVAGEGETP